jgi:hypothetical protein
MMIHFRDKQAVNSHSTRREGLDHSLPWMRVKHEKDG